MSDGGLEEEMAEATRTLAVRGAAAIGVAGEPMVPPFAPSFFARQTTLLDAASAGRSPAPPATDGAAAA